MIRRLKNVVFPFISRIIYRGISFSFKTFYMEEYASLLGSRDEKVPCWQNKSVKDKRFMQNNFENLKKLSIKEGTLYLHEYINYIYSDPISLKSSVFFSNLTEILYSIFGDEKQDGWLEKAYKNYIESDPIRDLTKYQLAESELQNLISLLSPKSKNTSSLFALVLENLEASKYIPNESNLPNFTKYLISSRSYDHPILLEYKNLFQLQQNPKSSTFKFELILSSFEFYLFVFVHSMKKFKTKASEPKYIHDFYKNDLVTQLCTNPYLILLRRYLDFFFSEGVWNLNQKKYFRKLVFLIEDYFINDLIYSSPTMISSKTAPILSINNLFKNPEKLEIVSKEIPCPHIHYAISLLYHYLNKIIGPFTEETQASYFLLGMSYEEARVRYAKLNYTYLINCLKYWNKDLNNPCNLADLGTVWANYIRPWEIFEPNLIDDLNKADQTNIVFGSNRNEVQTKYPTIFDREKDSTFLASKDHYNILNSFIMKNLLFYTNILKEFIGVLSENNTLSFRDIIFFREMLSFFFPLIEKNGDMFYVFLFGHIRHEELKELSRWPKKRVDPGGIIKKHIEEMGADYADLSFLDDEAVKARIIQLMKKITKYNETFIKSMYSHTKKDEFEFINEILKIDKIFHVSEDQRVSEVATSATRTMHFDGIQTVFSRTDRVQLHRFHGNQWVKAPGASDFFPLYVIFYNIAKTYDRLRGINVNEKTYLPTLQIRNLSKRDNFYRFVLIIIFLYCLYRLLFTNRRVTY